MKKLILSLFTLVLMVSAYAQDANKSYKSAKKSYSSANVATDGKIEKLKEAAADIDLSMKMADKLEDKNKYKAYKLAGDIYGDIATAKVQMSYLGKKPDLSTGNDALKAYEGYMKAYNLAEKKYQKKESIEGLRRVADHLSNYGRMYYGEKQYGDAYTSFNSVLEAKKALDAKGDKVLLVADSTYNNHLYLTGLSALLAEQDAEAKRIFVILYDNGVAEPAVYESLFKLTQEEDEAAAVKYLEDGRAKYPDDEGLRIAEINYYLKAGKLDELTGKLAAAIEKDPNNISLYTTLGYVHDNLFQKEKGAGNDESATKHYDAAMKQYSKAIELDPNSGEAQYSIGALIYNKAAVMTKDLAALENDYSPKGIKKYEAKKTEIFGIFDQALPYFLKAEKINPNDEGTLIALKEIYAKKDNLEKYNEYKARLEKVQSAGN